jgi:hypothetical protein
MQHLLGAFLLVLGSADVGYSRRSQDLLPTPS